jgi:hypothetical protein
MCELVAAWWHFLLCRTLRTVARHLATGAAAELTRIATGPSKKMICALMNARGESGSRALSTFVFISLSSQHPSFHRHAATYLSQVSSANTTIESMAVRNIRLLHHKPHSADHFVKNQAYHRNGTISVVFGSKSKSFLSNGCSLLSQHSAYGVTFLFIRHVGFAS